MSVLINRYVNMYDAWVISVLVVPVVQIGSKNANHLTEYPDQIRGLIFPRALR